MRKKFKLCKALYEFNIFLHTTHFFPYHSTPLLIFCQIHHILQIPHIESNLIRFLTHFSWWLGMTYFKKYFLIISFLQLGYVFHVSRAFCNCLLVSSLQKGAGHQDCTPTTAARVSDLEWILTDEMNISVVVSTIMSWTGQARAGICLKSLEQLKTQTEEFNFKLEKPDFTACYRAIK